MQLFKMADSITVSALPAGYDAYAGYVGGYWPDYSLIAQSFPHAKLKSIAVTAAEDADILDCEAGDATPAECPGWLQRQHARGLTLPGVYASLSTMPAVAQALKAAGLSRDSYVLWVASWDGVPSIPAGYQAKQYSDRGPNGENYDRTIAYATFWDQPSPPPVRNAPHYDWFDSIPRWVYLRLRVERDTVQLYDRLRAMQTPAFHPRRVQLAFVRRVLKWFAGRVWSVAHEFETPDGGPSWGVAHRGWRWQQLHHRAQGQRFV